MKPKQAVIIVISIILGNISLMAQTKINIAVNGHNLTATLEENSSAKALAELLTKGSVTVDAHEYGGFEMVGALPVSLPRNDEDITTRPGDIILYTGNNICFYYGVNSWDFTRLGTVDNPESLDLRSIYGAETGSARFVLTLASGTGIAEVTGRGEAEVIAIHSISGEKVAHNNPSLLAKGVYLITVRDEEGNETVRKTVV